MARHIILEGGSGRNWSGGGTRLAVGRICCAHLAKQVSQLSSHSETRAQARQDLLGGEEWP